jgi:hypothetical protein
VKGSVEEGVGEGFVEIVDGDVIGRTFIFEEVQLFEAVGDILPNGEGGRFFDDDHINAERF